MKKPENLLTIPGIKSFCLGIVVSAALFLPSQASADDISLNLKNVTVKRAIAALQQSHYSLTVDASQIDMERRITVAAEDEPIENVLAQIFAGQDVSYEINGRSIVVTRRAVPRVAEKAVSRTLSGVVRDDKGATIVGATVVVKGTTTGVTAGIYGSRASNGVILITTKKGTVGKGPEIVFEGQIGWESPSRKWDFMNAEEFLSFVRPAIAESYNGASVLTSATAAGTGNGDGSIHTTRFLGDGEAVPAGWRSMTDPVTGRTIVFTDTDEQGHWFRDALWAKAYVGVTGGNENVKYAASVSYADDGGVVAMTDYSVFTMHGSADFKISKRLSASTTFDLSRSIRHPLVDNYFNSLGRGLLIAPTHRDYDADGNLLRGGDNKNCHTAMWYETYYDRECADKRATGNFNLNWEIVDGLTATAQYAMHDYNYRGSYYYKGNSLEQTRSCTETRTETLRDQFTAYLNFDRTFKRHQIGVTAGYDYMAERYRYLTANSTYAPSDKVPVLQSGGNFTASNKDTKEVLISYFGRVNYNFDKRYILSFTARADGSSKFAPGNKWGFFPAGAAAWNVSDEKFWNVRPINDLKLRVSYGMTGNNGIGLYDAYGSYSTAQNYAGHSTTIASAMANSALRWETTTQFDIGFDLGMFQNRLRIVADYYNKVTDHMIFSITLPDTSAYSSVKANVGSARFSGFELEVHSINVQKKNFTWTTDLTYTYNRNRVLSLPDEYKYTDVDGRDAWRIGGYTMTESGYRFGGTAVGEPLGRIYGYKMAGIIQSQAQAAAALYSNQPNVTRMIRKLESELGCALFFRSPQGVRLTPEGEKLYTHIAVAFESIEAGEEEVLSDQSLQSGIVHIAASSLALRTRLLQVLARYRRAYPHVRICLTNHSASHGLAAVQNGLADFAILAEGASVPDSLTAQKIDEIQEIPICGPAFLELTEEPVSLKRLADYPIISLTEGTSSHDFYAELFLRHGLSFSPDVEVETTAQVPPVVQSDLGVGFVPREMLYGTPEASGIYPIMLEEPIPARSVFLFQRKTQPLSIAAKKLRQMLLEDAPQESGK